MILTWKGFGLVSCLTTRSCRGSSARAVLSLKQLGSAPKLWPVGVLLMSLRKSGRRLSHSFGLRSLIPYTNQCWFSSPSWWVMGSLLSDLACCHVSGTHPRLVQMPVHNGPKAGSSKIGLICTAPKCRWGLPETLAHLFKNADFAI